MTRPFPCGIIIRATFALMETPMGLRIIDRHKPAPKAPVTEAEIMAGLAAETSRWPTARGFGSLEAQRRFLDHVKQVRARLVTPAEVTASAQRVMSSISAGQVDATDMHGPVDVATLLELL